MRVDTMIDRVVARFIGTKHERDLKLIQPRVNAINALALEYEQLSDAQLLVKTAQLRPQVKERLGNSRSTIHSSRSVARRRLNRRWCRRLRWCAKKGAGSWACAISTCR